MCGIHLEDMKDRRHCEAVTHCQEGSVDVIDELRCVRHRHFVGVAVEDIECDARNESVAKRGEVCEKVTGIDAWISFVPSTPLVDDELYTVFRIDLPHDLPMIPDEFLHAISFGEELVPAVRGEMNRVVLLGPTAIVMERTAVELAQRFHTLFN